MRTMTALDAESLFSHFPVKDSLEPFELVAIMRLSEDGVNYFIGQEHVVRETFGSTNEYRQQHDLPTYLGEQALIAC